jgi:integrase
MTQTQIIPQTNTRTDVIADLFGDEAVVAAERSDERSLRWMLWNQAIETWLDQKRSQSEHTASAYSIAVQTFFEWAAYFAGEPVYPGDVGSAMSTEFAGWLRREGKAVERDPDTGGRAPWDRDDFNPLHAPDWIRWQDGESIYLRRVIRDDESVTETRITKRGALATSSVNLKLAALRNLWDFVAVRYNAQLPDGSTFSLWPAERINPFDPNLIERHKPPKKRAKYPSVDELKSVLSNINLECLTGKRDFALIFGFAQTCRRFSEFINIRWGDIDHTPIADGPNAGDYTYTFEVAKKRREERVSEVLDRTVYQAICQYLTAAGRLDRESGIEPDPDEYIWTPLFPSRLERLHPEAEEEDLLRMASTPITNGTVNEMLKKYGRRAGVDTAKMHIHALRHAGARLRYEQMKRSGQVDPQILQMLLKHEGLNTTMVYIEENLEDPEDPGGREAAMELLRGAQNRQKNRPEKSAQQDQLI